jgi:DNA invertase Pin-like site-specific DNA recombinase
MGDETVPVDVPQQVAASQAGPARRPGRLNAVITLRRRFAVATSMRGGCRSWCRRKRRVSRRPSPGRCFGCCATRRIIRQRSRPARTQRKPEGEEAHVSPRFAFYGRVSTEDQQDPEASRNWQRARAQALTERHGDIVTEFFDVGQSRSIPWKRRPEANALLIQLKNPDRGFDAVVIGEPQRAFYGNQYGLTFPVFTHYGVQLWVPEVGGPIDPESEAHDLVMSVFGGMSKGERSRIKVRVRAAMSAQAQIEGRFLGGSRTDTGSRRRPASEPGQGRRRQAAAPPRAGPRRRARRGADLRRVRHWARHVRDRRGADPRRDRVAVSS